MRTTVQNIINWIKANKGKTFLLVVVIYLLFRNYPPPIIYTQNLGKTMESGVTGGFISGAPAMDNTIYVDDFAPQPNITDRKVITESNLALLVKNVEESVSAIKVRVDQTGGYVVNTSVTKPEFGANGYVIIRVPVEKLDDTLAYLKDLAVKVVSENISGRDITDQYEDITEKLRQLEGTKARFEQFMAQAQDINEILRVQKEILNLQSQIDTLKGKKAYLDGASSTTLITINLSTDELGLPYAPAQSWRPEVVFKQAVRSLVFFMQDIGTAAIWILVYIPVIALGLLILIGIKRFISKKTNY